MRPQITFCISDCGDPRLKRTLDAIQRNGQGRDQVMVEKEGTIPHSKNVMLPRATGEIVVYICADQEPPDGWLDKLIAPILEGKADFTCGPTKSHPNPYYKSKYDGYLAECERRNYFVAAHDQVVYPMCNTAWKKSLLDSLVLEDGNVFDERFAVAADDIDLNIRATEAGFRGAFVEDAWVWHDQSHLNTFFKVAKRRTIYTRDGRFCEWINREFLEEIWWKQERPKLVSNLHWLDAIWLIMDTPHLIRLLWGLHRHRGEVHGTGKRGILGGLF